MDDHIKKMDKDGCLYSVAKAFSELDLSLETFDSIKMGYIFENLIGRFYQNVDAGQYYTGRDIIKVLVSVLLAEGCDDIFDDGKVITVCDQACGTGGMLSTAYSYIKHFNPTADVRLFGQELMGQSYAVGLAEMLIKGQNAQNFRHADTFKADCFADNKMRFVIENPPFGTPWSGENAKYYRDVYRRYRDYAILFTAVAYVLQIIDANVFAYMQDFDVSDDISMRIEPAVLPLNYASHFTVPSSPAVGMRIGIKF